MIRTISHLIRKYFKETGVIGANAAFLFWVMWIPMAKAQEAPPIVINLETQQPVDLTRAYWNANVDIANRPVVCDHFGFNPESAVYDMAAGSAGWPGGFYLSNDGATFTHEPLLRDSEGNATSSNVQHDYILDFRPWSSFWTVQNGIYSGIAPFDSKEHLELVNYNTTTTEITLGSTNNAIRVWHSADDVRVPTYSVCYALDDRAFIPTGSAEIGNNDLPTLDELNDFTFQFPKPIDVNTTVPVIYRRNTGEQVKFVRGEWAYNEQIALEFMHCILYRWEESYQNYTPVHEFSGGRNYTTLFSAYFDGGSVSARTLTSTPDANLVDLVVTSPESFQLLESFQMFGGEPYMELTDDGFNLWDSPQHQYMRCEISSYPMRVLPLQSDNCDYSTADQYDGWGWNEITRESCAPLDSSVGHCDYSNADTFDGWGWNETTRESCAPLSDSSQPVEQVTAEVPAGCDYNNAALSGGWGWNESTRESCAPLSDSSQPVEQVTVEVPAGCDYSNAALSGGWGWNESTRESCSPL